MARLEFLLSILLSVVVTACRGVVISPSPALAPTQGPTATAQPSLTPAPEALPGGVKPLTFEGEFIVTGEVSNG